MSPRIDWDALVRAAEEVRNKAYAPYSGFAVGAAVQANGRVFTGCNVENVSYPVGLCAERAALAAAVAAGCRDLQAVAVAGPGPTAPCGMCRQALSEFNRDVPLRLVGGGREESHALSDLLPRPFSKIE